MKHAHLETIFMVVFFSIVLSGPVHAQDTQYWNQHYGLRAELLGGIAVGSILDISTTYYNPGALALIESTTPLSAAFTLDASIFTLKDGAGEERDLSASRLNTIPKLVAGTLPSPEGNRFAYSFIVRQDAEFVLKGQRIDPYESLPGGNPADSFAGEVLAAVRMKEYWGGFTWARSLKKNIGFGLTSYLAFRGQENRSQNIEQFFQPVESLETAVLVDEIKYWNCRLLWKAGFSFDYSPLTFGATVTTPSVSLFGSGSSYINFSATDLPSDDGGSSEPVLISDYQSGLNATYKTSWAAALGAAYSFGKTALHFSAEWFDAVDPYEVLDLEPFQAQSSGEWLPISVNHALEHVTNVGIGIEHRLKEDLSIYGSFSTDFTAYSEASDISISSWDIYHITGGAAFSVKGTELTLGGGFEWGRSPVPSLGDFASPTGTDWLEGLELDAELRYYRIKFLAGFALPSGD